MKKQIQNLTELANLVSDALRRATHAPHIHPVANDMHAYIAKKLSLGRDKVFWFYRDGLPKRSVWVEYKGKTHFFYYDPRTEEIVMREEGRVGNPIERFDKSMNATTINAKLSPYYK